MHTMCMPGAYENQQASDPLELAFYINDYEPPSEFWELNSGSLPEQQLLLTP